VFACVCVCERMCVYVCVCGGLCVRVCLCQTCACQKVVGTSQLSPPPLSSMYPPTHILLHFSVSHHLTSAKKGYCLCCPFFRQHTATHCNTLQCTATHCNIRQHTATHCNSWQPREKTLVDVALTFGNTHQHTAAHYYTLQRTALQYTATPGSREKRLLSMLPSLSPCLSTNMRLGLFCLPKHTRPQTTVGYLECMCHCP